MRTPEQSFTRNLDMGEDFMAEKENHQPKKIDRETSSHYFSWVDIVMRWEEKE